MATAFAVTAAGIWLIAVGYELLRTQSHARSNDPLRLSGSSTWLYIWVGLGYGVRIAAGCWLGSGGNTTVQVLALCAAAGSALGTMQVTMVWVLEGTAFIGRGRNLYAAGLRDKAHLAPLLIQAGLLADTARAVPAAPGITATSVLRCPTVLTTVWNIALLAATTAAAIEGLVFASRLHLSVTPGGAVAAALVGAVAGVGVARAATLTTSALIAAAAAAAVALLAASTPERWAAPLPLGITLCVHMLYRHATYDLLLARHHPPTDDPTGRRCPPHDGSGLNCPDGSGDSGLAGAVHSARGLPGRLSRWRLPPSGPGSRSSSAGKKPKEV